MRPPASLETTERSPLVESSRPEGPRRAPAPSLHRKAAPRLEGFVGPPLPFSLVTGGHDDEGERVARAARDLMRRPRPLLRDDCSGLLETVLQDVGVHRRGAVSAFWESAQRQGRVHSRELPSPGDLVFFDDTYDANRNGRVDDPLSHIAVVVEVEHDGTVIMVHKGRAAVQALRMNLVEPHVHRRDGRVLNDYLRAPGYGSRGGPRLSGELFRAFARPPSRAAPRGSTRNAMRSSP
jgi:peptidoglycan DL-endopeptidase CwlO